MMGGNCTVFVQNKAGKALNFYHSREKGDDSLAHSLTRFSQRTLRPIWLVAITKIVPILQKRSNILFVVINRIKNKIPQAAPFSLTHIHYLYRLVIATRECSNQTSRTATNSLARSFARLLTSSTEFTDIFNMVDSWFKFFFLCQIDYFANKTLLSKVKTKPTYQTRVNEGSDYRFRFFRRLFLFSYDGGWKRLEIW
jgi:hypothetical protein